MFFGLKTTTQFETGHRICYRLEVRTRVVKKFEYWIGYLSMLRFVQSTSHDDSHPMLLEQVCEIVQIV